ncbi:MAG: rod shape-determining protein MreC [Bacteroidales bacterium]|nr:rod shape-determining protein MreC [Bacteroidales bacterium]
MENLFRFLKRYYHVFLFLFLEGISIYFITLNESKQSSSIVSIANNISGTFYNISENISSYFYLKSKNEALIKENIALRKQLETSFVKVTNNVHEENDTIYKQRFSFIDAKVISKTVNKRNNFFMLDKGSLSGVETDMGVISPEGVVGVVVKTTQNFSLVMSVLHQDSKLNVRNIRTKTTGTLIWNGNSYAVGQVIDMPSSIPIKKGDTVVTSGFSRDFPEGIMIGTVKDYTKESGTGFYKVNVQFSADYNKLEFVYIIKNFFKIEQDELLSNIQNQQEKK